MPPHNPLPAINLTRNKFGSRGVRALLDGLQSNDALCVLDVRDNALADKDSISEVVAHCAARYLPPASRHVGLWTCLARWDWPHCNEKPRRTRRRYVWG